MLRTEERKDSVLPGFFILQELSVPMPFRRDELLQMQIYTASGILRNRRGTDIMDVQDG